MTEQLSFLEKPYPERPGFKTRETSSAAAESICSHAETLRARIFDVFQVTGLGFTPDEMAARLGESVLSVRPRITELVRLGRIVDAGLRRQNSSGKFAKVWVRR